MIWIAKKATPEGGAAVAESGLSQMADADTGVPGLMASMTLSGIKNADTVSPGASRVLFFADHAGQLLRAKGGTIHQLMWPFRPRTPRFLLTSTHSTCPPPRLPARTRHQRRNRDEREISCRMVLPGFFLYRNCLSVLANDFPARTALHKSIHVPAMTLELWALLAADHSHGAADLPGQLLFSRSTHQMKWQERLGTAILQMEKEDPQPGRRIHR